MKNINLKISKKLFDNCYRRWETRNIGGMKYTLMPITENMPKNLVLEYDKENDKIILSADEHYSISYPKPEYKTNTVIPMDNIILTHDESKLINKMEYNEISKDDQKTKRQEMNKCIQIYSQEDSNHVLRCDLNLRLLELFKRIVLNFTTSRLIYDE
jgi:hypothetical protein